MTVQHRSDGNSEAREATPAELEAAGIDPVSAVFSAAKARTDDAQVAELLEQLEAEADRESAAFKAGLEDLRRMLNRPNVVPAAPPSEGGASVALGRIQPVQRVDVGTVPAPFVAGAGVQVQHLGRVATHMNQAGISVQHIGGRREDPFRETLREAVDVSRRLVVAENASGALKSAADSLLEQAQIELHSMHENP